MLSRSCRVALLALLFRSAVLALVMHTDADLAGEVESCRSTSGWVLALVGKNGTAVILDWGSKRQTAVSRNTGEAEVTGLVDGTTTSLLPVEMLICDLAPKLNLACLIFVDSEACRLGVKKVRTSSMRVMRRTHRINLAWLDHLITECDYRLLRVDTKFNWANMFTKTEHIGEFTRQRDLLRAVYW